MNAMTWLILLAVLATVGSLISGIATMTHHGPVGHRTGEQWMFRRVGFQALALALIVFAVLLSAH